MSAERWRQVRNVLAVRLDNLGDVLMTTPALAAIRESRGMVGVNFATSFIRPDGTRNDDTPLEEMIRHMDHLIEHVGVDGVGLGSDFDGATIPAEIGDVRGLPRLVDAMRREYAKASLPFPGEPPPRRRDPTKEAT